MTCFPEWSRAAPWLPDSSLHDQRPGVQLMCARHVPARVTAAAAAHTQEHCISAIPLTAGF